MKRIKGLSLVLVGVLSLGINGCGGSTAPSTDANTSTSTGTNTGGSNTQSNNTTAGNFRDANVIGVEYKSGSQSGLTGDNGSYVCEKDKNVTFSIGNIELGTMPCKTLATPIDLVQNGDINNTSVVNIVRLLTSLDDDGNATNGMKILPKVRTLAKKWSKVNFGSKNFDTSTKVSTILSDLKNNKIGTNKLPAIKTAQDHFKKTLYCAYSGAFVGKYSGSDAGKLGVMISPIDGTMKLVGLSNSSTNYFYGHGSQSFGLNGQRAIRGIMADGSITFRGKVNSVNSASGTWSDGTAFGKWTTKRVGGVANAKYRVIGRFNFSGTDNGLFSMDIDNSNKVTGVAYSTTDDKTYTISGNFNGTDIKAKTNNGVSIQAKFDAHTGTISNTSLLDNQGSIGTFTGSGCKLN